MKNNFENTDYDNSNLQYLRSKGLSYSKISRMTGIPLEEVTAFLQHIKEYEHQTGIF